MPEERRRRRGLPGGLIDGFCGGGGCSPSRAAPRLTRVTQQRVGLRWRASRRAGAVSLALTFRWNGNPTDGVVRVSIEDRAQRPIFAFPARGPSAPAPDGLAAVLTPGESFSWTVAAVDENGEPSRVSKPIQFSVAQDR